MSTLAVRRSFGVSMAQVIWWTLWLSIAVIPFAFGFWLTAFRDEGLLQEVHVALLVGDAFLIFFLSMASPIWFEYVTGDSVEVWASSVGCYFIFGSVGSVYAGFSLVPLMGWGMELAGVWL